MSYLFSIYDITNIQQTPCNFKSKKLKTLFAIRKYYFLSLKKTTIFQVTDGILTLREREATLESTESNLHRCNYFHGLQVQGEEYIEEGFFRFGEVAEAESHLHCCLYSEKVHVEAYVAAYRASFFFVEEALFVEWSGGYAFAVEYCSEA